VEILTTGLRPGEKLTEALLDDMERSLPCAPNVLEVVSNSALRLTADHLDRLEVLAQAGQDGDVRRALFDLIAQIRGQKPGSAPNLRVVAGA
jgi:O-antigen biosynthesis protein WbqV